ncbi:AlbA family DNA-binding domain-containing protein [Pseudomonas fluorescens]|uniref:AlbA family DNA-binding domain-containing protein n=1 Tax=Pseudomonas fluorescens TaxID=294 RepID=UPI0006937E91|nr:ATP-binding protein [Pseudomonas fluorescens]
MDDESLIERLLYSGEGVTLDYKVQQYPHDGASNDDKSELLKDILAFSNAWRDETAYILIGVSNDTQDLVELDKDLDDSRLQQFINGKTNVPVHFSYRSLTYLGVKLGLYTIPVQDRPIYAKQQYGKVSPDVVYVRRGSATAIAKPDEIARMGAAVREKTFAPKLQVQLVELDENATPVTSIDVAYKNYQLESYPEYIDRKSNTFGIPALTQANSSYFRELAKYTKFKNSTFAFRFEISNLGDHFADDVRIQISAPSSPGFEFLTETQLPSKPNKTIDLFGHIHRKIQKLSNIEITSERNTVAATFPVGKIQSGETLYTEVAYFTQPSERLQSFKIRVFSDQLRGPIEFEIPTRFKVESTSLPIGVLQMISHH